MLKNNVKKNKILIATWYVQNITLSLFKSILGKSIQAVSVKNHDLEIKINSSNIYPILYFLQKHSITQFDFISDIICYDMPGKSLRFGIIYNLLSLRYNTRIRIISRVKNAVGILSISSLFFGACWMEREVIDLYGIFFFLNKDLRRILTDYGFNGYPLRKDFPLTGYLELFYDDNQKRVSYQLVELTQEYRYFKFKLV